MNNGKQRALPRWETPPKKEDWNEKKERPDARYYFSSPEICRKGIPFRQLPTLDGPSSFAPAILAGTVYRFYLATF
ncbi:MAG: hypothetical protein LBD46_01865 [Endomicrobium sp.]|nr:hypothetical protein [Endomicrobium sp.]